MSSSASQLPSHLKQYDDDFARQEGSGIHSFTEEHRRKNMEAKEQLLDLMPFADINKTNDCDLVYRYLIARKWDVHAAVKSIREYIKWRKDNNIDEVMWEVVDGSVQEMIATFFGIDREGYPVLWDAPNPKLVSRLLKSSSREPIVRAHFKMMESARFLSRTNGVDRISYVLDLTAVTMSSVNSDSIGILKEMSKLDQLYYPEIMRRMLICNGGWVVNAAWKVIRPLLDERVQKKIQFIKEAPSSKVLDEYIEAEHIHATYGGSGSGRCGPTRTSLVDQLAHAVSGGGPKRGLLLGSNVLSPLHHTLELLHGTGGSMKMILPVTPYGGEDDENDSSTSGDTEGVEKRPQSVPRCSTTADKGPLGELEFFSLSDDDVDDNDEPACVPSNKRDTTAPQPPQLEVLSLQQRRQPQQPLCTVATPAALGLSMSLKKSAESGGGGAMSGSSESFRNEQCHCDLTNAVVVGSSTNISNSSVKGRPSSLFGESSSSASQFGPPSPPVKEVLTPGRLGDGLAVEIQIQRFGKVIRGFHQSRLVGETQNNLIVSYGYDAHVNPCGPGVVVSPASSSSAMFSPAAAVARERSLGGGGGGGETTGISEQRSTTTLQRSTSGTPASPFPSAPSYPSTPSVATTVALSPPGAHTSTSTSRVLIGELLRESGHPIHTHVIVSDANRGAKFILMKRNFHQQIVIYQVVGDNRIQTSKTCKHTVFGEKAKMARCGERVSGCDSRDWAVWGKVRVGNREVRKYLAEKQGWSLLFYDSLAALPIQDLFSLAVGLMELWEE